MKRRAVTLVEILIASFILAGALLALLTVNSSSNRMTMDSYFEFLAMQIAQEPIEVFRAVGYPECMSIPKYPVAVTEPILNQLGLYPVESSMFERTISVDISKLPLCLVTVTVTPRSNSRAQAWLRRGKVNFSMKAVIPYVQ
ncbi:MAG: hypothetical protein HQM09_13145 [Candidatus Riflebacteria bacterium]|nr:hypothetical protein [Candidatus Riflebacteria bacterium]